VIIVLSGDESAPTWLLYLAAALIGLAAVMMVVFFVGSLVKKRLMRKAGTD